MLHRAQEPTEPLTPRQIQLLRTIAGSVTRDGCSPTIGELAGQLGVSRPTAFEHIEQLRRKGFVSHLPKVARSLMLTSKARRRLNRIGEHFIETADEIPLVGAVAAGLPVEAVENPGAPGSVSSFFGAADDVFALEVKGDSMAGADIHSGDYVICRRTSTATDGQLVVALVDNDNATLKRFYKERSAVRLEPANDDYEPIYSDNCLIQGVVIGLVRKL